MNQWNAEINDQFVMVIDFQNKVLYWGHEIMKFFL